MRIVDCEQNSFEWFACRTGRITASRICDVMAKLKNGDEAAARRNYRTELLCERLTSAPSEHYVTPAMLRGTEEEPFSRTAYEIATGVMVDRIGFIFHATHDFTGASPDGIIGSDGGVELKNPTTEKHLTWLVDGEVPDEHKDQLYWSMACSGRTWWDFCSHDSRLPDKLRLFIKRLPRDDKRVAEIEREVLKFNAEIEYLIAQLGAESTLPPIEAFVSVAAEEMVSVGDLSIPKGLSDMLDAAEIVP